MHGEKLVEESGREEESFDQVAVERRVWNLGGIGHGEAAVDGWSGTTLFTYSAEKTYGTL